MNNEQIVSKLVAKKNTEVLLHNAQSNISYLKVICRYCLEINNNYKLCSKTMDYMNKLKEIKFIWIQTLEQYHIVLLKCKNIITRQIVLKNISAAKNMIYFPWA